MRAIEVDIGTKEPGEMRPRAPLERRAARRIPAHRRQRTRQDTLQRPLRLDFVPLGQASLPCLLLA